MAPLYHLHFLPCHVTMPPATDRLPANLWPGQYTDHTYYTYQTNSLLPSSTKYSSVLLLCLIAWAPKGRKLVKKSRPISLHLLSTVSVVLQSSCFAPTVQCPIYPTCLRLCPLPPPPRESWSRDGHVTIEPASSTTSSCMALSVLLYPLQHHLCGSPDPISLPSSSHEPALLPHVRVHNPHWKNNTDALPARYQVNTCWSIWRIVDRSSLFMKSRALNQEYVSTYRVSP